MDYTVFGEVLWKLQLIYKELRWQREQLLASSGMHRHTSSKLALSASSNADFKQQLTLLDTKIGNVDRCRQLLMKVSQY